MIKNFLSTYNRHTGDETPEEAKALLDETMADLEEAELADFVQFQGADLAEVLQLALDMAQALVVTEPSPPVFGDRHSINAARHNAEVAERIALIQAALEG